MNKTYWHLPPNQKPSQYDLQTSKLLYYPEQGFAIKNAVSDWYQQEATIKQIPWHEFSDPRRTTYESYIELQYNQEIAVKHLLEAIENSDYDQKLPANWLTLLDQVLPQLRYVGHTLQMQSAYLAHLFPESKVVNVLLFHAADAMRQVYHFAYRTAQLQITHTQFGLQSEQQWLQDPRWQALRQQCEQLLATYSWLECFVLSNVCFKPLIDYFFLFEFGQVAQQMGDYRFTEILNSLYQDTEWHRACTRELMLILNKTHAAAINNIVQQHAATILQMVLQFAENFAICYSTDQLNALEYRCKNFQTLFLKMCQQSLI